MYCATRCCPPNSLTLRLLNCEKPTETIRKCRRRHSQWQSAERRWCLNNNVMLRRLSSHVQQPLIEVCTFLFQLTLAKFGQILNPRCSQWSYYRVPFVRPDTCAIYDGIFDNRGNLRNPLHPFIEYLVLIILDHYLSLPCEKVEGRRNTAVDTIYGRGGGACKDVFKDALRGQADSLRHFFNNSKFGFGGLSGSNGDADADAHADGSGDGDGKDDVDGENKYDDGDDDDHENGNGRDSSNRLYNKYGDVKDGGVKRKSEKGGKGGGKGKRRKGSKGSKGSKGDDDANKRKKNIKDISNLYSDVVEERYTIDLPTLYAKKKAKKRVKVKKRGGGDQKVIGVAIPVLVHEPFDEQKPWTWIRRHPAQTRVLEGTRLGRAKVRRYQRETLKAQVHEAKRHQSVQSVYSAKSVHSVASGDMFGHPNPTKKGTPQVKSFNYARIKEVLRNTISARLTTIRKPKPQKR
ncbi:GH25195 [Drosophila grimshawi]|uniref:GH25195 n=1 Tax=Drosophila grimshawi TaxID=7222 RepID=B4JZ75_DROGR|nr:GH25195 [Drosophila grimshawi]